MKKLLIIFLGIFLISCASSLDNQLHNCYGDSEMIICYTPSDEELIWLSGELPEQESWTGGGGGADYLTSVPPEEIPPEEIPKEEKLMSLFAMIGLDEIEYGKEIASVSFLFMILFIFLYTNRKRKKEIQKLKNENKNFS